MSNDKFKVKKGIKLETNSSASDTAGELRSDGTNLLFYGSSEKTIATTDIVSGTNTGDVTLATVGSSPADAGASLSGQVLTLQPADATHAGVVSTGAQTFAGAKTFSSTIVGSVNGNAATVTTNANLSGDVSSSGNTTTIGALKVTNSMLAGSIDATSKLTGAVPIANGGTANGSLAVTAGGTLYTDGTKVVNVGAGTSGQVLTSAGASAPAWATPAASPTASDEISNLGLATSVSGSALTIALKQSDGSTDPGAGAAAVKIGFRSSTLTSGAYNQRSVTSALSMTISSGSTLGQSNAVAAYIYVYALDNAGTVELACAGFALGQFGVTSTTAEGGAGAADNNGVVYSTTARTNVPYRLIGKILNTQTTAGTWASAGTTIQVGNDASLSQGGWGNAPGGVTVQRFTSGSGTYYTPAGVKYLKVTAVGGGGGGAGGGVSTPGTAATAGASTTFGSSLITAPGGGLGGRSGNAAGSGAPTINSPAVTLVSAEGGTGGGASYLITDEYQCGAMGGGSSLGGAGAGGAYSTNAKNGGTNTGGGGGGGSTLASGGYAAGGGSAGATAVAIINFPSTSYAYAVGAGGTKQTAATNGSDGGDGAAGVLIIEEYYN